MLSLNNSIVDLFTNYSLINSKGLITVAIPSYNGTVMAIYDKTKSLNATKIQIVD